MRKPLIYLVLAWLALIAPVHVFAQDTPWLCSFNCDNSFTFLKNNCLRPADIITRPQILAPHINPYKEFDSLMNLLLRIDDRRILPSYTFSACEGVCNAASLQQDGVQLIYYSQEFLDGITGTSESKKWAIRCIIAHEIGHHFFGHTLPGSATRDVGELKRRERRADYFSGFVIRQYLGATLENAMEGINTLDPTTYRPQTKQQEDVHPYPLLINRRQAVREGYEQALTDSIRLSMLQSIDSVATILIRKYRRSIIFRTLDESLSVGDLKRASNLIDKLLTENPNSEQKEMLYQYRSRIQERLLNNKEAIKSQLKVVELAPDNVDELKRLKELYKESDKVIIRKKALEVDVKIKALERN